MTARHARTERTLRATKSEARPAGRRRISRNIWLGSKRAGLLVRGSTDRSTRTRNCIRWCAGSSRAACRRRTGAPSCSPTWSISPDTVTTCRSRSGALAASAQIYAVGMGRPVEDIGTAWTDAIAHPIAPVLVTSPPCQEVVITGDELRGPGKGLGAPAGAGFDAGLRFRALSHGDVVRHARSGYRGAQHGHVSRRSSRRPIGSACAWPSRIGGAGGYCTGRSIAN